VFVSRRKLRGKGEVEYLEINAIPENAWLISDPMMIRVRRRSVPLKQSRNEVSITARPTYAEYLESRIKIPEVWMVQAARSAMESGKPI